MSNRHNLTIVGLRRHHEIVGETRALYGERVVAPHLHWLGESREQSTSVVSNGRCLAVHQRLCGDNSTTKHSSDCLMTKAYPHYRYSIERGLQQRHAHPAVLWSSWTGRDEQMGWGQRQRL